MAVAGDTVNLDIADKHGVVAEVLEGLGIALADHVGAGIVVKDVDKGPGADVLVEGVVVVGCIPVVLHQRADGIGVGAELVIVGVCGVLAHDGLCIGGRVHRTLELYGVDGGDILVVAGRLIVDRGKEGEVQTIPGAVAIACAVVPEELIGAVVVDGVENEVDVHVKDVVAGAGKADCDLGGRALAVGY